MNNLPEIKIGIVAVSRDCFPESLSVNSDEGGICCTVYGSMPTGMETTVKLRIDNYLLTCVLFGDRKITVGSSGAVQFSGSNILLFDRSSGRVSAIGRVELK